MARKAENVCSLALYRKSVLTSTLEKSLTETVGAGKRGRRASTLGWTSANAVGICVCLHTGERKSKKMAVRSQLWPRSHVYYHYLANNARISMGPVNDGKVESLRPSREVCHLVRATGMEHRTVEDHWKRVNYSSGPWALGRSLSSNKGSQRTHTGTR